MCTGTIYHMTRCGHSLVYYTSHCRRYEITNPPEKRAGDNGIMSEPPGEPCPKLHSGNDNKPVSVVSIDDSCAICMPRAKQWDAIWGKHWVCEDLKKDAAARLAEGDRLAPSRLRASLMRMDRATQDRLASIDWHIIPAPEPVYPPSWTVEDDQRLRAKWIGCWLVWGDNESYFQEQRQLYEEEMEKRRIKEAEEKKRKKEEAEKRREQKAAEKQSGKQAVERRREQEEKEDESDYDDEDDSDYDEEDEYEDAQRVWRDNRRPWDAGINNDEEPPADGSSTVGYLLSDDSLYGDQDQPSDTDPRSTHSHKHHPQLRKKKGREVLGESEFFSFATLDDDDGRDDPYYIDDNRDDDDDDVWMRISSEQPRYSTTTTGHFPDHSVRTSQWTPDDPLPNRSKRLSTQAVQGSGKRYDLKPFIPSQHHQG